MKLVEILARELEEWPAGVNKLHQSIAGMIFYIDSAAQVVKLVRTDVSRDWRETSVTRADWEAERAKLKEPKANGDGWVRHRGGKCPVEAGTLVDVRLRCKHEEVGVIASDPQWVHYNHPDDVMRWRIHKPAEQLDPSAHKHEQATEQQSTGPDLHGMLRKMDGPDVIKWRDRIRELDTQRAEVESTYQRQISEITQERELLVQKLAGEGLALVEVVVGPVEDMSDWRNWRVGDLVKLADKVCEETGMEPGSTGCISEFDKHDTRGNYVKVDGWYWPLTKNLTWVSRPAS